MCIKSLRAIWHRTDVVIRRTKLKRGYMESRRWKFDTFKTWRCGQSSQECYGTSSGLEDSKVDWIACVCHRNLRPVTH